MHCGDLTYTDIMAFVMKLKGDLLAALRTTH